MWDLNNKGNLRGSLDNSQPQNSFCNIVPGIRDCPHVESFPGTQCLIITLKLKTNQERTEQLWNTKQFGKTLFVESSENMIRLLDNTQSRMSVFYISLQRCARNLIYESSLIKYFFLLQFTLANLLQKQSRKCNGIIMFWLYLY